MHDVNVHVYTFVCIHMYVCICLFWTYVHVWHKQSKNTRVCLCMCLSLRVSVYVPLGVCSVCVLQCGSHYVCMLSGSTSSGHWLLLFDVEVLAATMCVCVCVCGWVCVFKCTCVSVGLCAFVASLFYLSIGLSICLSICLKSFNSLLYSRWKPAATTLMSLWKCRRSWLDVELRRAGAVVPVNDRDKHTTEPVNEFFLLNSQFLAYKNWL